jgi:hypothetical protein
MVIQVSLENRKRRELADAVGEVLGAKPAYKGPPTYEYEVGDAIVGREGTVTLKYPKRIEQAVAKRLLEGLRQRGFAPQLAEDASLPKPIVETTQSTPLAVSMTETTAESSDKPVIRIPLDGFGANALENIRLLVNSKAAILKKALDASSLVVQQSETTIDFPWFDRDLSQSEVAAYTNLITAMGEMAKRQKRVMAVEKPTDNEKFVFRLFLVRLGLIGDEYADTRRILLRNLKGNGSCKSVDGKATPRRADHHAEPDVRETTQATETGALADNKYISLLKQFGYFLLHIDD